MVHVIHHNDRIYSAGDKPGRIPPEALAELRDTLGRATPGPISAGAIGDDDGPRTDAAFIADVLDKHTRAGSGEFWSVHAEDEEGGTIAFTGNGPTSHANAVAIACLLNAGPDLVATIDELEAEVKRLKADHLGACRTVALMHGAIVGEGNGAIRGVVEDVEDVVAERAALRARVDELMAEVGKAGDALQTQAHLVDANLPKADPSTWVVGGEVAAPEVVCVLDSRDADGWWCHVKGSGEYRSGFISDEQVEEFGWRPFEK